MEYYPPKDLMETSWWDWWRVSIIVAAIVLVVLVLLIAFPFRRKLRLAAGVIVGLALGLTLFGLANHYLMPIRARTEQVSVGGEEWVGLHMTDLHRGSFERPGMAKQLLKKVTKVQVACQKKGETIKYIFWTGDYLGLRSKRAEAAFDELLRDIRALLPGVKMFAVAGGHEVEFTDGALEKILGDNGVVFGRNKWVVVDDMAVWLGEDSDHKSRALVGGTTVESWSQYRAKEMATVEGPLVSTWIIMCHDPNDVNKDNVEGIDLILSGHRHVHKRRQLGNATQLIGAGFGPNVGENNGKGMFPLRFTSPGFTVVRARRRASVPTGHGQVMKSAA